MLYVYILLPFVLAIWAATWPMPYEAKPKRQTMLDGLRWPAQIIWFTTSVAFAVLKRQIKGLK